MDSQWKPKRFYMMAVVLVASLHILKLSQQVPPKDSKMQWENRVAANNLKYNIPPSRDVAYVGTTGDVTKKFSGASGRLESDVEVEEWERDETPPKKISHTDTGSVAETSPGDESIPTATHDDATEMDKVPSEGDASIPKVANSESTEINQIASGEEDSNIPNVTSEGDMSSPTASYNESAEMDKVTSEAGAGNPNATNHENMEIDHVASAEEDVGNPNASPAEKWEKLWRQNIELQPNATSENANEKEVLGRLLSFNHSITPTTPKESGALNKLFQTFPLPKHEDSSAIYSKDTYNRLISKLLLAQSGDRKFKIVGTGGSTTAGGGRPTLVKSDRYFARFTDYLQNMLSIEHTGIEYIDQGHGTRNSLHTAVLYDNFIPADADLLIWEFSVNDSADPDLKNMRKILETSKQSFLAWLHHINSLENPPFVMLLYYWNAPYKIQNQTTHSIVGSSFDSHGDIARQFDFVVGHANMGAYVQELQLKICYKRSCPMLSDKHHASMLGHMASAFLLLNLLSPDGAFQPSESSRTLSDDTKHVWTCGTETEAKKVLKNVITNSSSGWISPVGSWTFELPVYNQSSSSTRLLPAHPFDNIEQGGKADAKRKDRQRSTSLKFCRDDDAFSLVPSEPMKNVRVMLLVLRYGFPLLTTDHINVQINGSNATAPGELVPMFVFKRKKILLDWPCHFACTCAWGTNADLYWYVFESTEPAVHSVRICANSGMKKAPTIQSLAIW